MNLYQRNRQQAQHRQMQWNFEILFLKIKNKSEAEISHQIGRLRPSANKPEKTLKEFTEQTETIKSCCQYPSNK